MTRPNSTARTVVVVGGGISGLSAAHRLLELAGERGQDVRVRLLERAGRLGGVIRTIRTEGFVLEAGPDQFVRHKPAAAALCERLGLGERMVAVDTGSPATLVLHRGRPTGLPEGFGMTGPTRVMPVLRSPLFSWTGKLRIACEPWIRPPSGPPADESLRSFVTRRFGSEMHDRVFEPIFGGIFTSDADRMSLQLTVPQFQHMERKHGSLFRAMRRRGGSGRGGARRPGAQPGTMSLKDGLGELVQALAGRLPTSAGRTRADVETVTYDGDRARWRIDLAGGGRLEADGLILASPARASARMLREDAPALASALERAEYASCATVNLAYPASAVGRRFEGNGFFVGKREGLPILACSYVSVKFAGRAPRDTVLLRAFVGGARDASLMERDDEELTRLARQTLERILGIRGEPLLQRTSRYPTSMPQLEVGDGPRLAELTAAADARPGLFLCGGATGAIGLPDCIASGESAASRALDFVGNLPHSSLAAASEA